MNPYRICVVGGHCGNRMMIVVEHLQELLRNAGCDCKLTNQNVWDHPSPPARADLILQLMPAFTEAEAGCPVINIKPMLADLDDPVSIEKILNKVQSDGAVLSRQAELPVG